MTANTTFGRLMLVPGPRGFAKLLPCLPRPSSPSAALPIPAPNLGEAIGSVGSLLRGREEEELEMRTSVCIVYWIEVN